MPPNSLAIRPYFREVDTIYAAKLRPWLLKEERRRKQLRFALAAATFVAVFGSALWLYVVISGYFEKFIQFILFPLFGFAALFFVALIFVSLFETRIYKHILLEILGNLHFRFCVDPKKGRDMLRFAESGIVAYPSPKSTSVDFHIRGFSGDVRFDCFRVVIKRERLTQDLERVKKVEFSGYLVEAKAINDSGLDLRIESEKRSQYSRPYMVFDDASEMDFPVLDGDGAPIVDGVNAYSIKESSQIRCYLEERAPALHAYLANSHAPPFVVRIDGDKVRIRIDVIRKHPDQCTIETPLDDGRAVRLVLEDLAAVIDLAGIFAASPPCAS